MSGERELDAAGITDPRLRRAYRRCRALHAAHGRTYYLACRLLAPDQRPAVHALYGFARLADDLVDDGADHATDRATDHAGGTHPGRSDHPDRDTDLDPDLDTDRASGGGAPDSGEPDSGQVAWARRRLDALEATLNRGLAERHSSHPVVAAVVDTATRYRIPPSYFEEFLTSMRMDLTVTHYPSMAALRRYMRGSAEVIGLQMLPVLGTDGDPAHAEPAAAALGTAFQLTNFLRDVGEDLDRGRVYLPADVLAAHGVHRELLPRARAAGRTPPPLRAALAELTRDTRRIYREAEAGIGQLHRRSRPCVRTAHRLYGRILDLIEHRDYDVLAHRVVVSRRERVAVALPALTQAALTRAVLARPGRHRPARGAAGRRHRDALPDRNRCPTAADGHGH